MKTILRFRFATRKTETIRKGIINGLITVLQFFNLTKGIIVTIDQTDKRVLVVPTKHGSQIRAGEGLYTSGGDKELKLKRNGD
jgi:hypothetical protein